MNKIKHKFINSLLVIIIVFSPFVSFAQFGQEFGFDDETEGQITCDLWERGSDVWFANGCDLVPSFNCGAGYYIPPGAPLEGEACVPIPGGGGTGGGSGGGGGGGSTTTTTTANNSSSGCSLGAKPTIKSLFNYTSCIINISIIPFLFAIAIIAFLWGVIQYVLNSDNESEREKGKKFMLWGIIALTFMVAIWGIVGIVGGTFGLNTSIIPQVGK